MAGKPAARLTDTTAHGGMISGPGNPTVMIGKMPAATLGDMHMCPMMTPGTPPIPHVGGPITLGSTGVLIGKKPAARMGDMAVCVGPPSSVIMGCMTVLVGEAGSGSQAGSAASAAAAASHGVSAPGALKALEVFESEATQTESHPIDIDFLDGAGQGVAGISFRMKDPEGAELLGASNTEGKWHSARYQQAGSYEVTVLDLNNPQTGATELDFETSCQVEADAVGYAEGEPAWLSVSLIDAEGFFHDYDLLRGKVQGEKISISYQLSESEFRDFASLHPGMVFTHICFQLVAGFQCCTAELVLLNIPAQSFKIQVSMVEIPDVLFHLNSAVPCLDSQGSLIRALAGTLDFSSKNRSGELVILGHTDTSGEVALNYEIGLRRASAVAGLLTQRLDLWLQGIAEPKVEDYQQCLKALYDLLGWKCDPGQVDDAWGPATEKAVQGFQQECNQRLKMTLKVDGLFGVRSWKAMHRVLCGLIAEQMGYTNPPSETYPAWALPRFGFSEGEGLFSCGECFPIEEADRDRYRSEKNRRVDLIFIPHGSGLRLNRWTEKDQKMEPKDCLIYDPETTERVFVPIAYGSDFILSA